MASGQGDARVFGDRTECWGHPSLTKNWVVANSRNKILGSH